MDIRIATPRISGIPSAESGPLPAPKTNGQDASFFDTFAGAIRSVEGLQADADTKVRQVLTGQTSGEGQEIHSTMIAVEKADLAFQLMMQVRNKIVQAYQEISRMPF